MATNVQKITLSPSRDIPFNKLLLSQSNVRRIKAGLDRGTGRGHRPPGPAAGPQRSPRRRWRRRETGMFEIPAADDAIGRWNCW